MKTGNVSDDNLSMEQTTAIDLCCDMHQRLVGVTGGAGTGKTLVLGRAYDQLARIIGKANIALAAPTGRAAKRIQELTGIPARTIHRLLKFPMPDDVVIEGEEIVPNEPLHNGHNPIPEKVVFVDEASMVSPTLYQQLMAAMPKGGVIRFFGDNNQLPPVEEGEPPFVMILEKFPSVELTFNFRSDDAIVGNALRILRGQLPQINDRFTILYVSDPIKALLDFVDKEFIEGNNQIIMPTRKGKFGTMRANPSLQLRFNGKGPMLRLDRFDDKEAALAVRAKDKVIWIKNDYKLNLHNGEIGYISKLDVEDGSLELVTPDRRIHIPPQVKAYNPNAGCVVRYDPRKQIELGYAVTTHKSQGSEFDTVIYCMCAGQGYLLGKRNFYTAVTRAKHRVIIITDRKAMGMSVRPNKFTG